MGAIFINHLEEGSKNNPRKKQNKTKQNLHYNLYYNKQNGLAAQERDLWHLWTFLVRLGPARHATLSRRETRHPLIMLPLPCTNQMQKWTWKDVEGKTRCSVRAFRSHCEDRNSSADRAGGMNRKPTLLGGLSHLTHGTKVHSKGIAVWLSQDWAAQQVQATGGERCRKGTGDAQTGRLWQQRMAEISIRTQIQMR